MSIKETEKSVKIKKVEEITPVDGEQFGNLGTDAKYMIDCYTGDQARKYYTNGVIPADELVEIVSRLVCVLVEFRYYNEEYGDWEDEGKAMFVIDSEDGDLCNVDRYMGDYGDEVYEAAKAEAYKFVGVKERLNLIPERD